AVVIAALVWLGLRGRGARRTLARLRDLDQALTIPLPEQQQEALTQALATLATDDITAARMESAAREWVPDFDASARTADQPMRPIFQLMASIRQNSLVLTGLEQALLRAPELSASVGHLALLDYTLMAPTAGLEAAAGQVLREIASQSGVQVIIEGANQVRDGMLGYLYGEVGKHLADMMLDPAQLLELANHFAINHEVAGPALFEVIANHTDAVNIGIEFAQNMLHGPVADAAMGGAAGAAAQALEALHAASQALMENGLTLGQAGAEAFLQQHGDLVAGQMHQVITEHAGHSLFGGFPVVSGIVLGYKEIQIYRRGDADLGTVGKNWMTDVLSRYAGGQTGAAIGLLTFGPPGAIAGGIIGSVVGAMFGGHLNARQMNAARDQYNALEGQLTTALNQCADEGIPVTQAALTSARDGYLNAIGDVPRLETNMPARSLRAIQGLRGDIATELASDRQVVARAARIVKGGWLSHPFVRLAGDEARMVSQVTQRLDEAQSHLPAQAVVQLHPFTSLAQLGAAGDLPIETQRRPRYQQRLTARLADTEQGMPDFRKAIADWSQRALHAYSEAFVALDPTIQAQVAAYNTAIKPLSDQRDTALAAYEMEAKKLGKDNKGKKK
ncbi:MAG TPA: hypothetical protein VF725_14735, partial [Ktedonobacterales bacterium]